MGRSLLVGASLIAMAVPVSQALAQDADDNSGIADIIVTAQKREQNLQDVPIAVTAITTDALKVNRITNVLDLSSQVPNLAIRKTAGGGNTPNFMMRGSVSFGSVAGQDKAISMYLDGVFIGNGAGSAFELPDIERIEVLRGPQGTLFGRNSTAGAISIVTREPSGEFGVTQQFTYGNYDHLRSSTRIQTPAWGPFSASVSYTHTERKGDVKNLGAGTVWDRSGTTKKWPRKLNTSPKTLGAQNAEMVFAAVKFEPSDRFKMVYRYDWMEDHHTPDAFAPVGLASSFTGVNLAAYLANPPPFATNGKRIKAVNNSFTTPGYLTSQGHNLTATWKVDDQITVKNILAYRKTYNWAATEISGFGGLKVTQSMIDVATGATKTALQAAGIGAPYVISGSNGAETGFKQWSDELQINYDSDPLTLTVGAIYYSTKSDTGSPEGLRGSISGAMPGGVITSGQIAHNYTKGSSLAGYVQGEVHVTPQLDVVGGFRVTRDKKTNISYTFTTSSGQNRQDIYLPGGFYPAGTITCPAAPPIPAVCVPLGTTTATFNAPSYKKTKSNYSLGVNYRPNDDILLYAKYSTGFISGGTLSGFDWEPETVKAWEGGIKADLFDRKLRANLALFKADYKDLQAVSGGRFLPPPNTNADLGTLVLREGDLDTKGFELELTAAPVRGLTLNSGLGYTDFRFKNVNLLLRPVGSLPTIRPHWTTNMAAQYETEPMFGDADMMFRLDAVWRSKYRTMPNATYPASFAPVVFSDAMWIVNGRIALRNVDVAGAKMEFALWGRNLTNSRNPAQPIDFSTFAMSNFQRARTYGIDLNIDF